MTIRYKYIGIFGDNTPMDEPGGVVRVWTGTDGEQKEETFRSSLNWEPSDVFSPMARPDYYEYVEVDESVVERFIERVRKRYGGE